MITFLSRTKVCCLFVLFALPGLFIVPVYGQTDKPEAYLRFEGSGSARTYYVAVYIKTPLAGDLSQIRASLRDRKNQKLISTTLAAPPKGDDSTFIFRLGISEDDLFAQYEGYEVLVDSFPTANGVEDYETAVGLDVKTELGQAQCSERIGILVVQASKNSYSDQRFKEVVAFLDHGDVQGSITASVIKGPQPPEPRKIKVGKPVVKTVDKGLLSAVACVELESDKPSGEYTLKLEFNDSAPPELDHGKFETGGKGPDVPNATAEKRGLEDFLDLGLTLTSSVEEEEQPDKTMKRVRTTRGVMDLFFAPILNLRRIDPNHGSGVVRVFTPFYIDSKVSTGKITKDTLALNRIELGSTYEFRDYRIRDYSDLFRHALSFKHTSDRDFKQDEVKFVYEFQPIWGRVNRPINSAPIIFQDEPVEETTDKFGYQIVPIVGVELGRTYRVKDPKEFEGISRNVGRFYFGGTMTFDLTKYVQLSLEDLFYIRGENKKDRTENYFTGSIEAPLDRIGSLWAAHALFLSFERGEQAPFTSPSVNILKFGYRIRARDFFR